MNLEKYDTLTDYSPTFQRLLDERVGLEGCVVEFGAYNGGSAKQLATLAPERTVYTFDTFEGMPFPEFDSAWDHDEPGKFKSVVSPEVMFNGWKNVVPVQGRFIDTLPTVPNLKVVLAYLDCDLYVSYQQVLAWLETHLVPGGVIVSDDYPNLKAVKRALDDFCLKYSLKSDEDPKVIYWPL